MKEFSASNNMDSRMSRDLLLVIFLVNAVLSVPLKKITSTKHSVCPGNWLSFRDSCYYFETKQMKFDLAEVRCLEKGSTMFVADSVEEWNTVLSHAPLNHWSWIGLEQHDDEKRPRWTTPGGIDTAEIKWMLSPTTSEMNGWSSIAKCVAYFHSGFNSYAYFYYCGMDFYSICEKNTTLLAHIWDEGDRGF